jgi:phenylalanine-4-hydroxylase
MTAINQRFEEGLKGRGNKTHEDIFEETIEEFEREHGFRVNCVPGFTSYDVFRKKRRRFLKTNGR